VWPILRLRHGSVRPPYWLECVARLAPGIDIASARASFSRVIADVARRYPSSTYHQGNLVCLSGGSAAARPALL
jgi:hypothetical protein